VLIDQIVPAAVVGIIIMMILPLPNELLDLLLTVNLAFSIALLLSAVSIRSPERYTVLPSILLLSTLFRLGLNIATTRQLLSTGEAPDLVAAFGRFVVGGNLIVGAVVFLIITLVQFVVISKGAERVAEVAARFTLDAMPGKQISIDADLRSGILSIAEARERRAELQRESRLYGALDGAMKFIKGDAIAGLMITGLNIIAGVVIGTTIHGLDLRTAAGRYTLFTIGDGLVSQIPALLVSIAAGMVVTRVAGRGELSIGGEVFAQVTEKLSPPAITSCLMLALAFLPGMPLFPLLLFAVIFLFVAVHVHRRGGPAGIAEIDNFKPIGASPVTLHLSIQALDALRGSSTFVTEVQQFRKRLFTESGFILVEPELSIEPAFEAARLEVRRFGSLMAVAELSTGRAAAEALTALVSCLEKRLHEYMDDTQTRLILEAHECRCEDLINSVIPSKLTITALTKVLRSLLEERIPVSNLAGILQGVLEWSTETDPALPDQAKEELLSATVRSKLAPFIRERIIGERTELAALRLSRSLEHLLGESILNGGPILERLRTAITKQIRNREGAIDCVLADPISRRRLARIIAEEGLTVPVLLQSEVPAGIRLRIEGEIGVLPEETQLLKAA